MILLLLPVEPKRVLMYDSENETQSQVIVRHVRLDSNDNDESDVDELTKLTRTNSMSNIQNFYISSIDCTVLSYPKTIRNKATVGKGRTCPFSLEVVISLRHTANL